MLYLNISDSQVQLWKIEKNGDDIESEELNFQIQTKEELSEHLLYFRTCMKLELNRVLSGSDSLNIASLVEKKVC